MMSENENGKHERNDGFHQQGVNKGHQKECWLKRKLQTFYASRSYYAVFVFVLFFYPMLSSGFYARNFYFPDASEVTVSKGAFVYRKEGRAGTFAGVEHNGKKEFFSCTSEYNLRNNICDFDRDFYLSAINDDKDPQEEAFSSWKGKSAEISWFNQQNNIFSWEKRIVEIVVDGRVVISKGRVRDSIFRARDRWCFDIVLGVGLYFFVVWIIDWLMFRKRLAKDNK